MPRSACTFAALALCHVLSCHGIALFSKFRELNAELAAEWNRSLTTHRTLHHHTPCTTYIPDTAEHSPQIAPSPFTARHSLAPAGTEPPTPHSMRTWRTTPSSTITACRTSAATGPSGVAGPSITRSSIIRSNPSPTFSIRTASRPRCLDRRRAAHGYISRQQRSSSIW